MSSAGTKQIVGRQSASWLTTALRSSRPIFSKAWPVLAGFFLVALLLVSQVAIIGSLDRLGVSPQFSFLCLNLALLAGLSTPILYPLLKRNWSFKSRKALNFEQVNIEPANFEPTGPAAGKQAAQTSLPELVCKILVIRRLETNQTSSRPTAQPSYERTNSNAIAVSDWFSGS